MQPPQKQKQVADRDSADRLAGDLRTLAGPEWHRFHYGVAVAGKWGASSLATYMQTYGASAANPFGPNAAAPQYGVPQGSQTGADQEPRSQPVQRRERA